MKGEEEASESLQESEHDFFMEEAEDYGNEDDGGSDGGGASYD